MATVVALPGSIRRGSYNRLLLEAAAVRAPADVTIRLCDLLRSIPPFDEDLEVDGHVPSSVAELGSVVAAADGLLISTPEYNQSIPGVLKNAIDWMSRSTVLARKPVAVIGATSGRWGTRLAQSMVRHTLSATGALVLPSPTLYVAGAAMCFDAAGRLIDRPTRDGLEAVLAELVRWIRVTALLGDGR
jgi:chromate reductase, NAD(P)H dehydrogenase (quinone)